MKCDNCGKREATVKYTQNINGKYSKLQLCEECAKKLGLDMFEMNMPIDFSSFLGDMLNDYSGMGLLPSLGINPQEKCEKCGLTYDEFIHTGKFGCVNCYNEFKDKLSPVLKNLHGSSSHIGRKAINAKNTNSKEFEENKQKDTKKDEISKLQQELKKAVQEERYEDAAKIRDNIKKLEEK